MLYSATGNAWINPTAITISFMPDGTNLGGATSNLQSTFNNNSGLKGQWQNQILKAAQMWAQQTNINLVVVSDDGAALGTGNDQQGDPGMGDIRIGGYNFGNSTLAWTYQPPSANNFSIAGDIMFNTNMPYNVGKTYDLFSVAMHEFGHALGLGESSVAGSVMYSTYQGVKTGLSSDDIAGIQSIYSASAARTPDLFGALNSSFSTAASLTNLLDPVALTGLEPNLDIATAGQSEYFSVVAPTGTTGTMQVAVQSKGLSQLAPLVTVYASNGTTVVGSASGAGQYGTTLNVTVSGVTAGQLYYIKVQGADTSAFGTGDYALGLSFKGTAPPTEPSPIIAYANGNPLSSGGGSANESGYAYNVVGASPDITGISPDTGFSTSDGITSANRITLSGFSPANETITVYRNGTGIGTTVANAAGNWTFDNTGTALADGTYVVTATATAPNGTVSPLSQPFGVTIESARPTAPVFSGVAGGTSQSGGWSLTAGTTGILYGTAVPYSQVALYNGLTLLGIATTAPNGHWSLNLATGSTPAGSTITVTATATDQAGVTSASSPSFSVSVVAPPYWQPSAPTVPSDSVAAGSILGTTPYGYLETTNTPTINGTATASTEVVVFEDGIVVGVAAVAYWGGTWSFTCPTLTTGVHKLSFEDVNSAGVFSAPTGLLTIQV